MTKIYTKTGGFEFWGSDCASRKLQQIAPNVWQLDQESTVSAWCTTSNPECIWVKTLKGAIRFICKDRVNAENLRTKLSASFSSKTFVSVNDEFERWVLGAKKHVLLQRKA